MIRKVGPNGERCADCVCFDYKKDNYGYCRANAPIPIPQVIADEYLLVWPSTMIDDWCIKDFKKVGV